MADTITFCKKNPEKVKEWFSWREPHGSELRERNKEIFLGVLRGHKQVHYARKYNLPKSRIHQILHQYASKIYYHYV